MGSKSRIAHAILPIILRDRKPGQYYVEPFCGGCNVIDKVDGLRIASDSNPYLIAMFRSLQQGMVPPVTINRECYNEVRKSYNEHDGRFNDDYIGYIGFTGSYNGRFFDGGYSGHGVKIKNGVRDYITEARNNLIAQMPYLRDVEFRCSDYKKLEIPNNSIIYCDPPYQGVKRYSYTIDHDIFWQWCRVMSRKGHRVFISEYDAPNDFECIWYQEIKTTINQSITKRPVEKLFTNILK